MTFHSPHPRVFLDRVAPAGRRTATVVAAALVLIACASGTAAPPSRSGQSFEIEIRDTSWEGSVFGLVVTPPISANAPGCVALVGEIRPMSLPGVVSSGNRVPSIDLSAGQTPLEDATPSSCDVGDLEAAGYAPLRDARVTLGTTYRFRRVFRLTSEALTPEEPLVASVADPFDATGHVVANFEPRSLTSVPTPELPSPVPVTEHHTLLPPGSGFAYPDGATPWEGTITGLLNTDQVPVPPLFGTGPGAARTGRCVLIIGWLGLGGAPVDGDPAEPIFGVIAGGQLLVGGGGKLERCDTTGPAFAGFGRINQLSTSTAVTTDGYPFHHQIFIPETMPGAVEAITVRYPWSKNQWFLFEPTVLPNPLTGASARSQSVALLPVGDPAISVFRTWFSFGWSRRPGSATTTATVEWRGLVWGLVPIPTTTELGNTHHCLAVVGTLTVTRFEGFDLTMPPLRPDLGLMIDGRRMNPSSPESCDTSGLQEAGYRWFGATGDPVGNYESFYETFTLTADHADRIQAVVAGSVWFSSFSFFEPTTLHTIPPA